MSRADTIHLSGLLADTEQAGAKHAQQRILNGDSHVALLTDATRLVTAASTLRQHAYARGFRRVALDEGKMLNAQLALAIAMLENADG